jgi:hypothetical protein
MTLEEIESGFRTKQKDLASLNLAIAQAFAELPLYAEQSRKRDGTPGDTLRFNLRKPKRTLVANQFYPDDFLQFKWYLAQTDALGVTDKVRRFLEEVVGFSHPDDSPKPETKYEMRVNIYPRNAKSVEESIPRLMEILKHAF